MRQLFEFQCKECTDVFTRFIEYTKVTTCPLCGSEANKLISTPSISLEGISGSFPSASEAWANKHNFRSSESNI